MAFSSLFCKQSVLYLVIIVSLIIVKPSVAFGVQKSTRKSSYSEAIRSPLFRAPYFYRKSAFIAMPKQRKLVSRLIPFASSSVVMDETPKEDDSDEQITWKDRLLKVSNIASILCMIDCTVLPLVTIALPLLGLAAFTPAQVEWLHHFGHQIALYFVIPVGGTAAALNYSSHKQWKLSAPAALGLLFVYLANGSGGPLLNMLPHDVVHSLHCGTILHRATNVFGCALLLGSNYKSHQATHAHGDCCHHSH